MSEATNKPEEAKVEAVQEAAPEAAVAEKPAKEEKVVVEEVKPTEPRELAVPNDDFDWDSLGDDSDSMSSIEKELNLKNFTLLT